MKSFKFAILWILAFLMMCSTLFLRTMSIKENGKRIETYDLVLKNSCEDAAQAMIQPSNEQQLNTIEQGYVKSPKEIEPNLDKALETFYNTLFMNLGIQNDPALQEGFKRYVPLKMVVAYKGLYVCTSTEYTEGGKKKFKEMWQPLISFNYKDAKNNLIINYTLNDYVYITDLKNGYVEGTSKDMRQKYPLCEALSDKHFEGMRRKVITDTINNAMGYYTEKNNSIGRQNGFSYKFKIPIIDNDKLNEIDSASFIAFYQGLPIRSDVIHNNYALSASRITANKKYYGSQGLNNYYHTSSSCPRITGKVKVFNSRVDAAKDGYSPCPDCN